MIFRFQRYLGAALLTLIELRRLFLPKHFPIPTE